MHSDVQLSGDNRNEEVNNSLEVTAEINLCGAIMSSEGKMQLHEEMSSSVGRKRSRPVDEEEIWTEVGRKGKVMARSLNNGIERQPEEQIEISMTSRKEKLPKQIGLARILKKENILDVAQIKYVSAYKILFKFHNEDSAEKLIRCQYFIEKEYKCQKTFEVGVSYGVLKNIDLDLSEEDISQFLESDIPIIGIKRLQRRKYESDVFEDSESIRLCFKGPELPSYVYTYGTKVKVEPYVFSVTQCSNCWRFGHNHKTCSNKIACPKCGKSHPNCETTTFKCVNCSGQHMSLAKVCPVYLQERKLRKIMAEQNCTYKKAQSMNVPPVSRHVSSSFRKPTDEISDPVCENVVQSDFSENDVRSETYASVLRNEPSKSEKAERRSPAKKKTKRKKSAHLVEESSSENESDKLRNQNTREDKNKKEEFRKFDVAQLIEKVKDVIFMKKMTFEEKITRCGKLLYDWVINSVAECIQWPILKSLFQNG